MFNLRKIVWIIALLIILTFLIPALVNQFNVNASNDYHIHNLDTGLNYQTISEAIRAPETLSEHTIYVEKGNYRLGLVKKAVTLVGEDSFSTKITNQVTLITSGISIKGFNLRGGIELDNDVDNCVIERNILTRISLRRRCYNNAILNNKISDLNIRAFSNNNTIKGNYISNNSGAGIFIHQSSFNVIAGNIIRFNDEGIACYYSSNNLILNNSIQYNRVGINLRQNSSENLIQNNLIENNNGGTKYDIDPYVDNKGIWICESCVQDFEKKREA